jgi:acyl-CoA thioesterase
MSQALSSVIASTPSIFNPSNLSCYFLGPTLVNEDVYFTVDKVRDSGKSFTTQRVSARQIKEG